MTGTAKTPLGDAPPPEEASPQSLSPQSVSPEDSLSEGSSPEDNSRERWRPPLIGGLRGQLVAATVAAACTLVIAIVLVADPVLEFRESARLRDVLLRAAASASARLEPHPERADVIAKEVGAGSAARISVFGSAGQLLGDSAFGKAALGSAANAESAQRLENARHKGQLTYQEASKSTGETQLTVLVAVPDGTFVRASRPVAAIRSARESVRELLVVCGVMTVLVVALLTLVLSRTMVRPIRELTQAADALAAGNLDLRIPRGRSDELGVLGAALNQMANHLQDRVQSHRTEEARLHTVLDSMVAAVFVSDRRRKIVLANPALTTLLDREVLGMNATRVFASQELRRAIRTARKGAMASVEVSMESRGETRHLVARLAPLPDRGGVVGVLQDITQVRRADRIRRDFVANASHELRTPLTAIRGFAETLEDGAIHDPVAAARFVSVILKHTLRLQRLVDDLFSLSKAESREGPVPLEAVDLVHASQEVIQALESQAKQKGVTVDFTSTHGELLAFANERSLDEILVNLLDNAIKYTSSGGEIMLRVFEYEKQPIIEVSDTGPGIESKHQQRIFERFYRVDKGRSRDDGGTGLGLAIVRHLAEQMRAKISVHSEAGEGTTFRLLMPRAKKNKGNAQPGTATSDSAAQADVTVSQGTAS